MVFAVVAVALLWKRVVRTGVPFADNAKPVGMIALLVAESIGANVYVRA